MLTVDHQIPHEMCSFLQFRVEKHVKLLEEYKHLQEAKISYVQFQWRMCDSYFIKENNSRT